MPGETNEIGGRRGLPYDLSESDFQSEWVHARELEWSDVELAFRHGFDACGRFADRPFDEVSHYLRESWDAMAPPVEWKRVSDIVRSGYERYKGAGFGASAELTPEARDHFPQRTGGGSATGGTMGERVFLGTAEPVSDFGGEGGPPVGGEGRASTHDRDRTAEQAED